MRLLNVKTLCLEEFIDDTKIPQYAILSHRWNDHEITLDQLQKASHEEKGDEAFTKVRKSAGIVEQQSLGYIWNDTCCIDKTSSSDLQESINSMFMYYSNAAVCIAYLDDVRSCSGIDDIMRSKWWTRGWTLQELIAPSKLEFYATDWTLLGTKNSFASEIQKKTNIDIDTLLNPVEYLRHVSVAKRMSWASNRVTTREEDIAYCLLGIFGVNMTLLYGERENAFLRLQEEIMKQSTDQSLFAWCPAKGDGVNGVEKNRGLLASHPREFSRSGSIVPTERDTGSYSITNEGILLSLNMRRVKKTNGRYTAYLACHLENTLQPIGVLLQSEPYTMESVFFRSSSDFLMMKFGDMKKVHRSGERREVCVARTTTARNKKKFYSHIRTVPDNRSGLHMTHISGRGIYIFNEAIFQLSDDNTASVSFKSSDSLPILLTYGVSPRDSYTTFITLSVRDNSDISLPLLQHSLGRKAVLHTSNNRTIKALLSWGKVLDHEVLTVDVWVKRTFREAIADLRWKRDLWDIDNINILKSRPGFLSIILVPLMNILTLFQDMLHHLDKTELLKLAVALIIPIQWCFKYSWFLNSQNPAFHGRYSNRRRLLKWLVFWSEFSCAILVMIVLTAIIHVERRISDK